MYTPDVRPAGVARIIFCMDSSSPKTLRHSCCVRPTRLRLVTGLRLVMVYATNCIVPRFASQLGKSIDVLLLTNDRANLSLAIEANIPAMTVHAYVESVSEQYPGLAELLAPETPTMEDDAESFMRGTGSTRRSGWQRPLLFREHKPMSELTAGIRQGR